MPGPHRVQLLKVCGLIRSLSFGTLQLHESLLKVSGLFVRRRGFHIQSGRLIKSLQSQARKDLLQNISLNGTKISILWIIGI